MTSYINNTLISQMANFLKPIDWLKGEIVGLGGRFPAGAFPKKGGKIQLNDKYSNGAKIKVSQDGTFPTAGTTSNVSILRTPEWFNGIVSYDHRDFQDLMANDTSFLRDYAVKVDALKYQHDQDVEDWFVGYSTTWANDPHVDNEWVPWFNAVAASSSSPSNPADMNHLVTSNAGTTGTEGTILSMGTVLTSTTTNMTIDFVTQTFQPIIRAFEAFKDANTGLRMVGPGARYTFMGAQSLISELKAVKVFDGEKILGTTVAQEMAARNIDLRVCEDFTASLQEDGTCQFGFVADFPRNFQIGILEGGENGMSAGPWTDTGGVLPKHEQGFESRYLPYTQPYYDGSAYWRKAFFHGSFVYKNDAA